MPSWEDVVAIAMRFPGVEEATAYGTPSLRAHGKGMCRLRTDPDALVMRVTDMGERHALVQGDPDVYFITPHYERYPYVLIDLGAVDAAELAELVEDAWRIRSPKRVIAAFDAER